MTGTLVRLATMALLSHALLVPSMQFQPLYPDEEYSMNSTVVACARRSTNGVFHVLVRVRVLVHFHFNLVSSVLDSFKVG